MELKIFFEKYTPSVKKRILFIWANIALFFIIILRACILIYEIKNLDLSSFSLEEFQLDRPEDVESLSDFTKYIIKAKINFEKSRVPLNLRLHYMTFQCKTLGCNSGPVSKIRLDVKQMEFVKKKEFVLSLNCNIKTLDINLPIAEMIKSDLKLSVDLVLQARFCFLPLYLNFSEIFNVEKSRNKAKRARNLKLGQLNQTNLQTENKETSFFKKKPGFPSMNFRFLDFRINNDLPIPCFQIGIKLDTLKKINFGRPVNFNVGLLKLEFDGLLDFPIYINSFHSELIDDSRVYEECKFLTSEDQNKSKTFYFITIPIAADYGDVNISRIIKLLKVGPKGKIALRKMSILESKQQKSRMMSIIASVFQKHISLNGMVEHLKDYKENLELMNLLFCDCNIRNKIKKSNSKSDLVKKNLHADSKTDTLFQKNQSATAMSSKTEAEPASISKSIFKNFFKSIRRDSAQDNKQTSLSDIRLIPQYINPSHSPDALTIEFDECSIDYELDLDVEEQDSKSDPTSCKCFKVCEDKLARLTDDALKRYALYQLRHLSKYERFLLLTNDSFDLVNFKTKSTSIKQFILGELDNIPTGSSAYRPIYGIILKFLTCDEARSLYNYDKIPNFYKYLIENREYIINPNKFITIDRLSSIVFFDFSRSSRLIRDKARINKDDPIPSEFNEAVKLVQDDSVEDDCLSNEHHNELSQNKSVLENENFLIHEMAYKNKEISFNICANQMSIFSRMLEKIFSVSSLSTALSRSKLSWDIHFGDKKTFKMNLSLMHQPIKENLVNLANVSLVFDSPVTLEIKDLSNFKAINMDLKYLGKSQSWLKPVQIKHSSAGTYIDMMFKGQFREILGIASVSKNNQNSIHIDHLITDSVSKEFVSIQSTIDLSTFGFVSNDLNPFKSTRPPLLTIDTIGLRSSINNSFIKSMTSVLPTRIEILHDFSLRGTVHIASVFRFRPCWDKKYEFIDAFLKESIYVRLFDNNLILDIKLNNPSASIKEEQTNKQNDFGLIKNFLASNHKYYQIEKNESKNQPFLAAKNDANGLIDLNLGDLASIPVIMLPYKIEILPRTKDGLTVFNLNVSATGYTPYDFNLYSLISNDQFSLNNPFLASHLAKFTPRKNLKNQMVVKNVIKGKNVGLTIENPDRRFDLYSNEIVSFIRSESVAIEITYCYGMVLIYIPKPCQLKVAFKNSLNPNHANLFQYTAEKLCNVNNILSVLSFVSLYKPPAVLPTVQKSKSYDMLSYIGRKANQIYNYMSSLELGTKAATGAAYCLNKLEQLKQKLGCSYLFLNEFISIFFKSSGDKLTPISKESRVKICRAYTPIALKFGDNFKFDGCKSRKRILFNSETNTTVIQPFIHANGHGELSGKTRGISDKSPQIINEDYNIDDEDFYKYSNRIFKDNGYLYDNKLAIDGNTIVCNTFPSIELYINSEESNNFNVGGNQNSKDRITFLFNLKMPFAYIIKIIRIFAPFVKFSISDESSKEMMFYVESSCDNFTFSIKSYGFLDLKKISKWKKYVIKYSLGGSEEYSSFVKLEDIANLLTSFASFVDKTINFDLNQPVPEILAKIFDSLHYEYFRFPNKILKLNKDSKGVLDFLSQLFLTEFLIPPVLTLQATHLVSNTNESYENLSDNQLAEKTSSNKSCPPLWAQIGYDVVLDDMSEHIIGFYLFKVFSLIPNINMPSRVNLKIKISNLGEISVKKKTKSGKTVELSAISLDKFEIGDKGAELCSFAVISDHSQVDFDIKNKNKKEKELIFKSLKETYKKHESFVKIGHFDISFRVNNEFSQIINSSDEDDNLLVYFNIGTCETLVFDFNELDFGDRTKTSDSPKFAKFRIGIETFPYIFLDFRLPFCLNIIGDPIKILIKPGQDSAVLYISLIENFYLNDSAAAQGYYISIPFLIKDYGIFSRPYTYPIDSHMTNSNIIEKINKIKDELYVKHTWFNQLKQKAKSLLRKKSNKKLRKEDLDDSIHLNLSQEFIEIIVVFKDQISFMYFPVPCLYIQDKSIRSFFNISNDIISLKSIIYSYFESICRFRISLRLIVYVAFSFGKHFNSYFMMVFNVSMAKQLGSSAEALFYPDADQLLQNDNVILYLQNSYYS